MARGPGRDQRGPMERLVRIAAVLKVAGDEGVSAAKLIQVGEYGGGAVEDLLGRDLRALRRQGWEIVNTEEAGREARYRMVTVDNRLRVRLTNAQLSALRRAVLVADREDLVARLGLPASERPSDVSASLTVSGPDSRLATVAHAVRHRCMLRFRYAGRDRVVEPDTVRTQFSKWYLVGREQGSDVVKNFVVTRMTDVRSGDPGTAGAPPRTTHTSLHPMSWQVDPPVEVTLRSAPAYVHDVERWLGPPVRRTEAEGHVDLVFLVTNRSALRARLYEMGPRVELLGPEEVRREVLEDLEAWTSATSSEVRV